MSRHGVLERIPVRFADGGHLLRIVRRILAPIGRRLDESNPMVDARLPDGGRINVVIPPLALEGPVVSIRKFRKDPMTPADLQALGTMSPEIAAGVVTDLRRHSISRGKAGEADISALDTRTRAQFEEQSDPYYATARLWDDGIIEPGQTRDVLGLCLSLAAGEKRNSDPRPVYRM